MTAPPASETVLTAPPMPPVAQPAASYATGLAELERLARLRDQGAISRHEYDVAKAKILAAWAGTEPGGVPPAAPEYGLLRQLTHPPAWARAGAGIVVAGLIVTALAMLAHRDHDVAEPDAVAVRVPTPPAVTTPPGTGVVTVPVPAAAPTVERYPVSQPPTITPRPWVATVAGDWLVTDFIRAGLGAGTQVTFRVRLAQSGATVTGTGDVTLRGQLDGATLRATYTHPSGGGELVWTFSADGSGFTGTFTSSLGNRGDSLGQRWAAASPWQVVSLFYTLLSDRRYEDAYALLSPRFQAQQPWPRWRAGYTTTLAVVIEAVEPVAASPPTVAVRVLATDLIDGRQVVRRFAGTWTLIGTADGWKLDVGRVQVVP